MPDVRPATSPSPAACSVSPAWLAAGVSRGPGQGHGQERKAGGSVEGSRGCAEAPATFFPTLKTHTRCLSAPRAGEKRLWARKRSPSAAARGRRVRGASQQTPPHVASNPDGRPGQQTATHFIDGGGEGVPGRDGAGLAHRAAAAPVPAGRGVRQPEAGTAVGPLCPLSPSRAQRLTSGQLPHTAGLSTASVLAGEIRNLPPGRASRWAARAAGGEPRQPPGVVRVRAASSRPSRPSFNHRSRPDPALISFYGCLRKMGFKEP